MAVTKALLDKGEVAFQTEGRLLQELGERLVASPEVALVELIKNAYDADSPTCDVHPTDDETALVVEDHGVGMSLGEFQTRWMRIATSHKSAGRTSPKYGRRITGQKGIGRFAVRFLGHNLKLVTTAFDEERGFRTRLVAKFDWPEIDKAQDLGRALIPFQLFRADDSEPTGTTLTVRKLRSKVGFAKSTEFRTSVLKIVSPLEGLERGRFGQDTDSRDREPGFRVTLPGDVGPSDEDMDLAKLVLSYAWAHLTIDLTEGSLTYRVRFHDGSKARPLRLSFQSSMSNGLFADIRFFPRRTGIFRGREVKGQKAWQWVRANNGVAVVDHGFRIRPYGLKDDDWLMLDLDSAHNERDWRSKIAKRRFPIPKTEKDAPAVNPMLNLPSNFQLVGAVFVESKPPSVSKDEHDLTPSMDREGFLSNAAFRDLCEVVRAGVEYLAREDKKRLLSEKERKAKEAAKRVRADFRAAVRYIQKSPTLTKADKVRLVEEYSGLAKRVEEVEEYDREARRKLETMSALGVVAGFMTHETTRIIDSMRKAIGRLRRMARRDSSLDKTVSSAEESYAALCAHIDYTRTFIDAVQEGVVAPFKAAAQVRHIIKKFGTFAERRSIQVDCEIEGELEAPAMPVPIYSGVLLNLYTNALKAIIAAKSSRRVQRIVFRGWNDAKWHTVEVLDTGIGIPPELHQRIWDPMFTTTSRLNNPLGSGMGLGLSLVRQLVTHLGGRVNVAEAPAGFSTCFQVEFPRKAKL